MRPRDEHGFSATELLVVVSLMLVILSAVFYATEAISIGGEVTTRQSSFAREISTPLHEMDKVLSQNKAIENSGGFVSDDYTLTTRSPLNLTTNTYDRHIYTAAADGTFTERIYRVPAGASAGTLVRTRVWSTDNANMTQGAAFSYLGASGETTPAPGARSVLVTLWSLHDGRYISGSRQIYFRNR